MPKEAEEEPIAGATVLEEIPGRTLTFLKAIANNTLIHAQLAGAGFQGNDYEEGWALLHAAAGYKPVSAPTVRKSAAFEAMQALDALDEDLFRRIRSALTRLHPEQAAFVFGDGLAATVGPGAVLAVKNLVERLGALRDGKGRKETRKEDLATLKTLESRGISGEELERLAGLVETAEKLEEAPELPVVAPVKEQTQALQDLYAWYKDWSETARSVVKKRAQLIALGLAKRRSAKAEATTPKPPKQPDPA